MPISEGEDNIVVIIFISDYCWHVVREHPVAVL